MAPSTRSSLRKANATNALQASHNQQPLQVILDDLPAEIINDIFGYLRPHDLTQLAQCSTKYRDITQSMLWHSVELHRQDAHHEPYGLSTQRNIYRSHLDDELLEPRSYRPGGFCDIPFEQRNAKFGTTIRILFRTAGQSRSWVRLAPVVCHMCISVTNKSPRQIWNVILSLPNLTSLEVIGECDAYDNLIPPQSANLRTPKATKVCSIRLRGYIPANFVEEICKASAATIVSLDIAALEPPKELPGDAEEILLRKAMDEPLYFAPRGILWFKQPEIPPFISLTHLLLCKHGEFDEHADRYSDLSIDFDEDHDIAELQQWQTLLHSLRSTLVEVLLEQRPIHLVEFLVRPLEISFDDATDFCPNCSTFDTRFYNQILKKTFDDGKAWPELKKLTLRGINLKGFEAKEGEQLESFAARVLPGVQVLEERGHYLFFDTDKGTILNQHGADGLKPQVAIPWLH